MPPGRGQHLSDEDLLADLTDAQRAAVTHFEGPLLVLAGAGSGNVKFSPERISGAISHAKNFLQSPDQYAGKAGDFFALTVAKVYYEYEKRMRASDAVDFDDLLLKPAMALRHDAELRSELDG